MTERAIKILLLEDNPGDAMLLEEYLEECRFHFGVRTAGRLTDGVDMLHRETFDLLLMDMNLPDAAGEEIIREVNRLAPDLPIIVMSGTADSAVERMVEAIPDCIFLRKGAYAPHELCMIVAGVLKIE